MYVENILVDNTAEYDLKKMYRLFADVFTKFGLIKHITVKRIQ